MKKPRHSATRPFFHVPPVLVAVIASVFMAFTQGCAYFGKQKTADTRGIEKRLDTTTAEIEKLYASIQQTLEILMRHEAVISELEAAIELEKSGRAVSEPDIARGVESDSAETPVSEQAGPDIPEKPQSAYDHALAVFENGHYRDAATLFDDFAARFPDHDLTDNALYWKGECFYSLKMYGESIRIFEKVAADHPTGNKVPDSLLKIGLARLSLNDDSAARNYLEKVVGDYPGTPPAAKAAKAIQKLPAET